MKYENFQKGSKKVKLTLKDKKILQLLEEGARQSHAMIARKVGLSRESVRYRIKQLEARGVIQKYTVVADIEQFGFINCHVFITLSDPKLRIGEGYVKAVNNLSFVRTIIKYDGAFDFEIAIIAKGLSDLEENLSQLFKVEEQHLGKQEIFLITKTYLSNKSLIKGLSKNITTRLKKDQKKIKVEEKDLEILSIIKDNARMPILSIAKKAKCTADIVSYRLKKMEEGGLIKKYVAALNYSALGQQVYTIMLKVRPLDQKVDTKLQGFFNMQDDIIWAVKAIGKYNVILYVSTEDPNGFHSVLEEIRRAFRERIISYEILIAYQKYKFTYLPEYSKEKLLEKNSRL